MDEPNPVKEILYNYLKNFKEEKTAREISAGNSSGLIDEIVTGCYPKIKDLDGDFHENLATFATSLLHYLLTEALIPSQRKVQFQGLDLDIVIPDLKSLSNDSKNTLIICVIISQNYLQKIDKLLKIQPIKENIWLVFPSNFKTSHKSFVIGEPSFAIILEEIKEFIESTHKRQFKIFKN